MLERCTGKMRREATRFGHKGDARDQGVERGKAESRRLLQRSKKSRQCREDVFHPGSGKRGSWTSNEENTVTDGSP